MERFIYFYSLGHYQGMRMAVQTLIITGVI